MATAMTGITIPNFVMAPLLTLIFGLYLSLLPVGGWGDGGITHAILPVTALALPQVAAIARLTRGSMIEVLRSNYVRTARAKGLPVAYLAFEGEQHGFRKAETIVRCLETELYFYGKVFGFDPADRVEPVHIDNL